MSRQEKDHPATCQCMSPHCLFTYGEQVEQWLGIFNQSTLQSVQSYPTLHLHQKKILLDNNVKENKHFLLFYHVRYFTCTFHSYVATQN